VTLGPWARKAALMAHVTSSVGWLGAVAASLAVAVWALSTTEAESVRAAYLALQVLGRWVLVPLSLASLLTGLLQALGTHWGLFRHYWVLVKLLMNLFATGVLLLYLQQLDLLADDVGTPGVSAEALLELRDPSPVVHAAAALVLLLVAVTLSVFKPRGMTRHGQRARRARLASPG
jgi:hypothetical protein